MLEGQRPGNEDMFTNIVLSGMKFIKHSLIQEAGRVTTQRLLEPTGSLCVDPLGSPTRCVKFARVFDPHLF